MDTVGIPLTIIDQYANTRQVAHVIHGSRLEADDLLSVLDAKARDNGYGDTIVNAINKFVDHILKTPDRIWFAIFVVSSAASS